MSSLDRVLINIKDVNKLAFKIFPKIFNVVEVEQEELKAEVLNESEVKEEAE